MRGTRNRRETAILVFGAVSCALLLYRQIAQYAALTWYGDSLTNILAVQSILETGLPYAQPPVGSANYTGDAPHLLALTYAAELYARFPFYLLSRWVDFDWIPWSALAYALLLLGWLIRRGPPEGVPVAHLALFLVMFTSSSLVSSAFWHCRYPPFLVMVVAACHFGCVRLAHDRQAGGWLPVLALALVPALFHLTALAIFFYWLGFLVVTRGAQSPGKAIALSIPAVAFAAGLAWKNRGYLPLEGFHAGILPRFFWVSIGTKLHHALPYVAVLGGGVALRERLSPHERRLAAHAAAIVVFSLACFCFVGSRKMASNPINYFLFLHPLWVLLLSLALAAPLELLLAKARNEASAVLFFAAYTLVAVSVVRFGGLRFDPHGLTRSEVAALGALAAEDPRMIFFGADAAFFALHFPRHRSYTLRDTPDPAALRLNQPVGLLFLASNSHVQNIYGETLAGSVEGFCRAVREHPGTSAVFFRARPSDLTPELEQRLRTSGLARDLAPVKTETLLARICAVTDSP